MGRFLISGDRLPRFSPARSISNSSSIGSYWFIMNDTAIEQDGSDEAVDFLNDVWLLHAELTGDHISVDQFTEALRKLNESGGPTDVPAPRASS